MILFDNLEWPLLKWTSVCFEILSWNKVKQCHFYPNLLRTEGSSLLFNRCYILKTDFSSNWGNPSGLAEGAEADSYASILHFWRSTFISSTLHCTAQATSGLPSALHPQASCFRKLTPNHSPTLHIKINPEVLLQWCSTINKFLHENSHRSTPPPTNSYKKNTTTELPHRQISTWRFPQEYSAISEVLPENIYGTTKISMRCYQEMIL